MNVYHDRRSPTNAARALVFMISVLPALCLGRSADAEDALFNLFMARSFPPDLTLASLTNPWGERLEPVYPLPGNFPERVVIAAAVYASQGIRFDGYLGSENDGRHYLTAADGLDNAHYGNKNTESFDVRQNGMVDDLTERVWICLDMPVHAFTLAGFPLREAMIADWEEARDLYTIGGTFPQNEPKTEYYFRRVRNMNLYFERKQMYVELRITKEQVRDRSFRPELAFQPGDLVIMGHYGDTDDPEDVWDPKHSGIVATVDARGLPERIYNMRVSKDLLDYYDGTIEQTRVINGEEVYFHRYSDRYSLIGFGRIVNGFQPEPEPEIRLQPWEETE